MSSKTLNVIGIIAMVGGLAAEFVSNWVNSKQTEEMIIEKIQATIEEHKETK